MENDQTNDTSPANPVPIVLAIDDEPSMRELMRDLLAPQYKVILAHNGREGIDTAREILPDLVVSDVNMPGLNGYEVCQDLKQDKRTSHIPVILLTGRSESEQKVAGFESGADAYVTKPFVPPELLAQIRNLISLREHLRDRFKAGTVLRPGEVVSNSMDDSFIDNVTRVIESHVSEEHVSMDGLCREIGMSRSQVHRKLVALTGMSLRSYMRYLRLHHAKQLLEIKTGTVSEIAFQVGFSSVAYFSKCFRQQFGTLPSEVLKSVVPNPLKRGHME